MINIVWGKAPKSHPLWLQDLKPGVGADCSGWHREESDHYVSVNGSNWLKRDEGTWFSVYRKPAEPAWNGAGLPPVGTVCEFQHRNAPNGKWHPTTVRYSSHAFVVYVDSINDVEECWRVDDSCGIDFRPTRTAEQIAADERLHEIRNALTAINFKVLFPNDLVRGNILAAAVEAMIDAGYRKQVQP